MSTADTSASALLEFTWLLLELEGQLVDLAQALRNEAVEAVLLNGPDVRPALEHGFADSFDAELLVPRRDLAAMRRVLDTTGWHRDSRRRPWPAKRYWRKGVGVVVRARVSARSSRLRRAATGRGRYGFLEPAALPAPARWNRAGAGRGRSARRLLAPTRWPSLVTRWAPFGAEVLANVLAAAGRSWRREIAGLEIDHGHGVFTVERITERYVAAVLEQVADRPDARVVEVGTGTGAVALAIGARHPTIQVVGIDTSARALGWARRNRRRLDVRNVDFRLGSLLGALPQSWAGSVEAIAANLPCLPPRVAAERRAVGQPRGTATGPGPDGLGLVRELVSQARSALAPGGVLVLHLASYHSALIDPTLTERGYERLPTPDVPGRAVIVSARWPGQTPS